MELPALIALETGVEEPYVLTWSPDGSEEGLSCYAYVVMKRKDGLLLALPPPYLPVSVLQRASGEEDYLFGPHTKLVVPAVKGEEGAAEEVTDLEVLVIDVKEEIAGFLRAASNVDVASEEILGFSLDEFQFPESDVLPGFAHSPKGCILLGRREKRGRGSRCGAGDSGSRKEAERTKEGKSHHCHSGSPDIGGDGLTPKLGGSGDAASADPGGDAEEVHLSPTSCSSSWQPTSSFRAGGGLCKDGRSAPKDKGSWCATSSYGPAGAKVSAAGGGQWDDATGGCGGALTPGRCFGQSNVRAEQGTQQSGGSDAAIGSAAGSGGELCRNFFRFQRSAGKGEATTRAFFKNRRLLHERLAECHPQDEAGIKVTNEAGGGSARFLNGHLLREVRGLWRKQRFGTGAVQPGSHLRRSSHLRPGGNERTSSAIDGSSRTSSAGQQPMGACISTMPLGGTAHAGMAEQRGPEPSNQSFCSALSPEVGDGIACLHQRGRLYPDQAAGAGEKASSSKSPSQGSCQPETKAEVSSPKAPRSRRRGRISKKGKNHHDPLSCSSFRVRATNPNTGGAASYDRGHDGSEPMNDDDGEPGEGCQMVSTAVLQNLIGYGSRTMLPWSKPWCPSQSGCICMSGGCWLRGLLSRTTS